MNGNTISRLEKLETATVSTPTKIFGRRLPDPGGAENPLTTWQEEVAAGRAAVRGDVLIFRTPILTIDEWLVQVNARRENSEEGSDND